MKAKILELMQREGLKPGQLAELLDISPAIISHILSERNKPSLDLLCKILRRFPQINPDWLLLDDPNMYRPQATGGSDTKDRPTRETDGAGWSGNTAGNGAAAATDKDVTTSASRTGFHGGLFDITGVTAQDAAEAAASRTVGIQGQGHGTANTPAGGFGNVPGANAARPQNSAPILRVVICYADGTFEDYRPTVR